MKVTEAAKNQIATHLAQILVKKKSHSSSPPLFWLEDPVVAQFTDKDKTDKEYVRCALLKSLMCFDTIPHFSQKTCHPIIIKCTIWSCTIVIAFMILFSF